MGGYAAAANGWKWPIYELLWLTGFTLLLLIFWFPETNAETILLQRAKRIRKRTQMEHLTSESEAKQAHLSASSIIFESLLRPFQLMTEPVILYLNLYIALGYAIFYCKHLQCPYFHVLHHSNTHSQCGLRPSLSSTSTSITSVSVHLPCHSWDCCSPPSLPAFATSYTTNTLLKPHSSALVLLFLNRDSQLLSSRLLSALSLSSSLDGLPARAFPG